MVELEAMFGTPVDAAVATGSNRLTDDRFRPARRDSRGIPTNPLLVPAANAAEAAVLI